MSTNSRPRPKSVAEEKIFADAQGLTRVIDETNRRLGLIKQNKKIGPAMLARFAAPLGGSKYPSQWGSYKNGALAIPTIDKLIAAVYFQRRPQDIFPSWKFPMLTLAPPIMALHETMQAASQQHLLQEWLKMFLMAATPQRREAMLREAQGSIGFI